MTASPAAAPAPQLPGIVPGGAGGVGGAGSQAGGSSPWAAKPGQRVLLVLNEASHAKPPGWCLELEFRVFAMLCENLRRFEGASSPNQDLISGFAAKYAPDKTPHVALQRGLL